MGVGEIIALIGAAEEIYKFIAKQKAIAERTGAWTPEQRAQVDARWQEFMSSPAWQTSDEGGNP